MVVTGGENGPGVTGMNAAAELLFKPWERNDGGMILNIYNKFVRNKNGRHETLASMTAFLTCVCILSLTKHCLRILGSKGWCSPTFPIWMKMNFLTVWRAWSRRSVEISIVRVLYLILLDELYWTMLNLHCSWRTKTFVSAVRSFHHKILSVVLNLICRRVLLKSAWGRALVAKKNWCSQSYTHFGVFLSGHATWVPLVYIYRLPLTSVPSSRTRELQKTSDTYRLGAALTGHLRGRPNDATRAPLSRHEASVCGMSPKGRAPSIYESIPRLLLLAWK